MGLASGQVEAVNFALVTADHQAVIMDDGGRNISTKRLSLPDHMAVCDIPPTAATNGRYRLASGVRGYHIFTRDNGRGNRAKILVLIWIESTNPQSSFPSAASWAVTWSAPSTTSSSAGSFQAGFPVTTTGVE